MTLASVKVFIADRLLGFWKPSTMFTLQSSGRSSAWRSEMAHGAHLGRNGHYQPVAITMLYGTSSVPVAWPFLSTGTGCVLKWEGVMCFLYAFISNTWLNCSSSSFTLFHSRLCGSRCNSNLSLHSWPVRCTGLMYCFIYKKYYQLLIIKN